MTLIHSAMTAHSPYTLLTVCPTYPMITVASTSFFIHALTLSIYFKHENINIPHNKPSNYHRHTTACSKTCYLISWEWKGWEFHSPSHLSRPRLRQPRWRACRGRERPGGAACVAWPAPGAPCSAGRWSQDGPAPQLNHGPAPQTNSIQIQIQMRFY